MIRMITASQIISELREIAAAAKKANGGEDYTYVRVSDPIRNRAVSAEFAETEVCSYVHHPDTARADAGCIVGVWLHSRHGVPLAKLAEHEDFLASQVVRRLDMGVTTLGMQILDLVQRAQDNGVAWGEAIRLAIKNVGAPDAIARDR